MKDLTSQFAIQPNGTYACSMPGCKGILKVEFAQGAAKPWVKISRLMPGCKTPKSSLHQSRGNKLAVKLFFPSMAQLTLSCESKPISVSLVEFENETATSEEVTEITNTITEQVSLNEAQQKQLDDNDDLDAQQQQQIENNTTIINQLAGGIGEEAAKALVDKVFGTNV